MYVPRHALRVRQYSCRPRILSLRLVDVEGGANAAVLSFNQEEKLERYNMADTLKSQHAFHLTRGHACYSDMGRIFCTLPRTPQAGTTACAV